VPDTVVRIGPPRKGEPWGPRPEGLG
jgi:hypothetical protein